MKDEKMVYKLIIKMDKLDLKSHLIQTRNNFDITKVFDKQGYSPLHFAAYKNNEAIAEVLCEFVS